MLTSSRSAAGPVDRSAATSQRGGAGLAAAGVLLAIGGLPFAVGAGPGGLADVWRLAAWPVGGVILVVAAVLLAVGVQGEPGLVGRDRRLRAATVLSGVGPLLLILVFLLSWTSGLASVLLVAVQLVTGVATAGVAVALLRRGEAAGAARWAFALLAAVDAVALVLVLLPPAALAFQVVVALVRPLALVVAGVLLAVQGTGARRLPGRA